MTAANHQHPSTPGLSAATGSWRQRLYRTGVLSLLTVLLPGLALAADIDSAALRQQLQSTERAIADRMRDEARRPVEVLEFLGLEPGMSVLDVYAADGYFTLPLAWAVGAEGHVYAQNPTSAAQRSDDPVSPQPETLPGKLERHALEHVTLLYQPITRTGLAAESIDFVLVSQILHDYYNRSPARAQAMLHELYRVLRPGGVIGVIDHSGAAGNDNARLHRMEQTQAIDALQAAGFAVEAESDLLANPADNPRRSTFDPALHRRTDQFLLRARKP